MKFLVSYIIHNARLEHQVSFAENELPLSLGERIEQCIQQVQDRYPMATHIEAKEMLKNKGQPYLVDQLFELIRKERPDITVEQLRKKEWMILRTDRESYEQGAFALTLPEAKKFMSNRSNKFDDFVYLRRYGLVLFNIGKHTSHQIFTSIWHWIETVLLQDPQSHLRDYVKHPDRDNYRHHQERFLHDCLGFYMSRAMNLRQVEKSTNMRLTAAEKMVFGHVDFDELSPLDKERD